MKQKIKYLVLWNASLTAVENKVPNISSLVKKTDYNTKITEIENRLIDHNRGKNITTPEFNRLTAENFAARLKQANLVTKADFDDKLKSLNQKSNPDKTEHLLVENELRKLKTLDSSYFRGRNCFEDDDTQNYLVFQPELKYFKREKKYILYFRMEI